jgi:hypothetical protein
MLNKKKYFSVPRVRPFAILRVTINQIHLVNVVNTINFWSGFINVHYQHFGAVGFFDVFDVRMFVGRCVLATLGVLFAG